MDPSPERRRYQRYLHRSPMDLYREDAKDYGHYAEMIDCCDKGLSLKTNEKLTLGELVYIELKNYDTDINLPIKKQKYSGIIRWGIRYPSTQAATHSLYKYGIEFQGIIIDKDC